MLASFNILRHNCNSDDISSCNPSGVEVAGSKPMPMICCFIAGVFKPLLMAVLSVCTMPRGVAGGATSPRQPVLLKPGTVSATVGRWGAALMRRVWPTASALTRPEATCGCAVGSDTKITCTCPAIKSVSMALPPRYGTCTSSMPASLLSNTPPM